MTKDGQWDSSPGTHSDYTRPWKSCPCFLSLCILCSRTNNIPSYFLESRESNTYSQNQSTSSIVYTDFLLSAFVFKVSFVVSLPPQSVSLLCGHGPSTGQLLLWLLIVWQCIRKTQIELIGSFNSLTVLHDNQIDVSWPFEVLGWRFKHMGSKKRELSRYLELFHKL